MRAHYSMGLTVLTAEGFGDRRIIHGFSTRGGGTSKPPFSSLNLAYHVGDDPQAVAKNRQLYFAALGLDLERSTWAEQVHGSRVAVVDHNDVGRGALSSDSALPATDAMVTNLPSVSLAIMTADCVPILAFDPVRGAIGAAHAGWRGTLAKLAVEMIRTLKDVYGTQPSDCQVVIGPAIGGCCFQVGPEVVEAFTKNWTEYDDLCFISHSTDGWYIDLALANSLILQGIGISGKNIFGGSNCTCCHPQEYFSYRSDQGRTGRMAAVIGLVE